MERVRKRKRGKKREVRVSERKRGGKRGRENEVIVMSSWSQNSHQHGQP